MVWVCGSDSRQMRELQVREEDEDKREAGKIDRGVSERCNYSSQQGEGEITTHSMLRPIPGTPPVCACKCGLEHACMYLDCVKAPHASTCALLTHTRTGRKPVEGKWAAKKKMSNKVDRVHISIITAGCTHSEAHMSPSAPPVEACFASWLILWVLWSCVPRWIWGVNENLISSSEPLQFSRTKGGEGVLDLINLFSYWIGCLPGADQLFPIMHLNVTRSYMHKVAWEKVLRKCLRASLGFLTGLTGSHMFIYVFAISLRPLSSQKTVSRQILKETKT